MGRSPDTCLRKPGLDPSERFTTLFADVCRVHNSGAGGVKENYLKKRRTPCHNLMRPPPCMALPKGSLPEVLGRVQIHQTFHLPKAMAGMGNSSMPKVKPTLASKTYKNL